MAPMPSAKQSGDVEPAGEITPTTIDDTLSSKQVLAFIADPEGQGAVTTIREDPDVVARRIMGQSLAAESAEDLFGEREVMHARDHLNQPYLFTDVAWLPSDVEGSGFPIYGVFQVADANGAVHLLTCGAKSVVLKLAKADYEGWLPRWLKIVQADKPTAAGYYPLDIVDAAAPQPGDF